MKKPILMATLCAGLILVTPFTVVAQESKVTANIVEEPDDIEGFVAQLRVMIDEILQKYGHIPMVSNLCNMIFNLLGLIGNILYCIFLLLLLIPIVLLTIILMGIGLFPRNLMLLAFVIAAYLDVYCIDYWPFKVNLALKSLYSLSETKNIINYTKDCPCLQE